MDLQEKDAYIAEHLMKLEPDTLRFMVADLTSEVQRLTQLCKEQGRKLVAEKVFSETSEVGVEFAEDAVARTQKELESERAERLHWFKRVKENESALTLHAEEKALMVAQMAGLDKAELAAALERVGELERDEAATRAYWSNAYYAMEAERDQLKRERQNVIEEAHRSALVNARNSAAVIEELRIEVEQLKRERDEYRDFLHPHTRDVLKKEQYRQGWENCREAVSDLLLLQPDRTHEECCDCALESVEPAQCAGHRAGPTECSSFVPVPERGKP